jgi:hypothetical protein
VSAKRIIIHSLADARAALAAAWALKSPVVLASAEAAGGYAGPAWFKALVDQARAEFPEARATAVLDCGDEAGTAGGAALKRLKDIAGQMGAAIETGRRPAALDLLDQRDPEAAARVYLAGPPRGVRKSSLAPTADTVR